jgi:hypothetical protein
MNSFLAAVAFALIVAFGAAYLLEPYQRQADAAFVTGAVRLPDHGTTSNLIGKDWRTP